MTEAFIRIDPQRLDTMLRTMAALPVGRYPLAEDQAELIKDNWRMLHEYDTAHCYTLNETHDKIRKETKR